MFELFNEVACLAVDEKFPNYLPHVHSEIFVRMTGLPVVEPVRNIRWASFLLYCFPDRRWSSVGTKISRIRARLKRWGFVQCVVSCSRSNLRCFCQMQCVIKAVMSIFLYSVQAHASEHAGASAWGGHTANISVPPACDPLVYLQGLWQSEWPADAVR
jgi:hypothetical protein